MESLKLFKDTLFQGHLPLALRGGEEVIYVDAVKLGTDAVDAAYALHDPCGVPWQIIVDQYICPVQVDTLCQNIRGNQQIVLIIVFIPVLGIKAVLYLGFERCGALAAVIDDPALIQICKMIVQVLRCFGGLGKYNDFSSLHHRVGGQIQSELNQFRVHLDHMPE